MEIIYENPPRFDEINAKFKIEGQPVIFTWGNQIFNPQRVPVPIELQVHEQVHSDRQGNDVNAWWDKYLESAKFRLDEELPAHVAEYKMLCTLNKDRNARARHLHRVALRLASPLYGGIISYGEARKLIQQC